MPPVTLELPLAAAAVIGTALIVLGIDLLLIRRWRHQIGRARTERERLAADQEQRAVLAALPVTFTARAWPPYGSPDQPKRAPLELEVDGASVWIHEVRLSFGSLDRGPRSAVEGMQCTRWRGDLPIQLQPGGRELQLDWPLPRMVEPEPISWELDVDWSVERRGPTMTSVVPGGDTNWQEA